MRDNKLIIWKFSSQSVPAIELQKRLQGKSQTPGPGVPEIFTSGCLITGILSTIRKGSQHLKFVWVIRSNTYILNLTTIECWVCMPVKSAAYFSLQSRQGPLQNSLSGNYLREYSAGTSQTRVWADTCHVKKVIDLLQSWVNQQPWTPPGLPSRWSWSWS